MNKTYEQILENMKTAYFNESHIKLDEDSLAAKRMEAVASELYAVSCYGDYIFKQAFVQSATGEILDRHGEIRDCARKTAQKATGTLTFYVDEPAAEKIYIDANTVCSAENMPYIQFATTEDGAIEAGDTSVTLPAQAIGEGYDYNVGAGTVTVMVNAPVGVSGVTNDSAFYGGYDAESDSAYRQRIMNNYMVAPNGFSCVSAANAVLKLDFVTDCFIPNSDTPGKITVVVTVKDDTLTEEQNEQIKEAVGIGELTGCDIVVKTAQPQKFSVTVELEVRGGFDKKSAEENVRSIVTEIWRACRIGEPLALNIISRQLSMLNEVSSFNIYSADALGEIIPCGFENYLFLDNLVVNCFD